MLMISTDQKPDSSSTRYLEVWTRASGVQTHVSYDPAFVRIQEPQDEEPVQHVGTSGQSIPIEQTTGIAEQETVLLPPAHGLIESPFKKSIPYTVAQTLFAEHAKELGYDVRTDEDIDGEFELPIALYSTRLNIACYIPMADHKAKDVQNLVRCLQKGYGCLLVCGQDSKYLKSIRTELNKTIADNFHSRFFFGSLESTLERLYLLTASEKAPTNLIINGKRVSISYAQTDRECPPLKKFIERAFLSILQGEKECIDKHATGRDTSRRLHPSERKK